MKQSLFIFSVLLHGSLAFSGGTAGGGNPPALEIQADTLMMLQSGALEGDLIRYTAPGLSPIYLRPDLDSIKASSMSARALHSGATTKFYVQNEAAHLQSKIAVNSMRTMKALMPGVLTVLPEDFIQKPEPKIEIVKIEDIDDGAMADISEPVESGDETSDYPPATE